MADTLQVLAVTGVAILAVFVLKRAYWPRRSATPSAPDCSSCGSDNAQDRMVSAPSKVRAR